MLSTFFTAFCCLHPCSCLRRYLPTLFFQERNPFTSSPLSVLPTLSRHPACTQGAPIPSTSILTLHTSQAPVPHSKPLSSPLHSIYFVRSPFITTDPSVQSPRVLSLASALHAAYTTRHPHDLFAFRTSQSLPLH